MSDQKQPLWYSYPLSNEIGETPGGEQGFKILASNTGDFIYQATIPDNQYCFVDGIGTNYFANCYMILYIDNEDVLGKIERQIGTPAQPYDFRPDSYKVRKSVKIYAYNGDTVSHGMEAIVIGRVFYRV